MSGRAGVAIVTGASSGIGAAAAAALAEQGYDVGITFRTNRTGAMQTARSVEEQGRRAEVECVDLRSPDDGAWVVEALAERLGGVGVLVNNAAFNRRCSVLEETLDDWRETLDINLLAPWACMRSAAKLMIESGAEGRIVNVSSVLAAVPLSGAAAYCSTKAALDGLTQVAALELAQHGIKVNGVRPGHTATPMTGFQVGDELDRPVIPLRRAAKASEVAAVIAFLASPQASYITGVTVLVDGGLTLASGPEELEALTSRFPLSD